MRMPSFIDGVTPMLPADSVLNRTIARPSKSEQAIMTDISRFEIRWWFLVLVGLATSLSVIRGVGTSMQVGVGAIIGRDKRWSLRPRSRS